MSERPDCVRSLSQAPQPGSAAARRCALPRLPVVEARDADCVWRRDLPGRSFFWSGSSPATARTSKAGHSSARPGSLLDECLERAGVDRSKVYVTNVVKHFKWEPRGKRRIHQKPNSREIAACRPWLDAEIAAAGPRVLVCLGATAAQAVFGPSFRVTKRRGEILPSDLAPLRRRPCTLRRFSALPIRDRGVWRPSGSSGTWRRSPERSTARRAQSQGKRRAADPARCILCRRHTQAFGQPDRDHDPRHCLPAASPAAVRRGRLTSTRATPSRARSSGGDSLFLMVIGLVFLIKFRSNGSEIAPLL